MRHSVVVEALRAHDPAVIGPFTLLARLGTGGMGRVYLGRSPGGIQVAVKVIREDIADSSQTLARFRREVATVRAVRSAYTASLIDASLDVPPFWLATEFVPGPTLLRAVRDEPLPPETCMALFAALAEGLAAVHEQGVVHRDVKPHNVILSATGPKLIDFGIARTAEHTQLTSTGQTPGTSGYAAPEVLLGGEAGPAADVFALGATMAAAATGRRPYGRGEWPVVSHRIVYGEIDVDGVRPDLSELIRECVAREPELRPGLAEVVRRCGVRTALAASPVYQRLTGLDGASGMSEATPTALATAGEATPAPQDDGEGTSSSTTRGRRRRRLVAGAALAAAAVAVTATVAITAWRGGDDSGGGETTEETIVTAWAAGPVNEEPAQSAAEIDEVRVGNNYTAQCWTYGDTITYDVYTNDKWVRLRLPGDQIGYVSAIFLRGDDQAGVANRCP
jgi:eukaryotic-like serine/threonine-protein kinase